MDEQQKVVSSAELKAISKRMVTGPSGLNYMVRRLSPRELMALIKGIPNIDALIRAARAVKEKPDELPEGVTMNDLETFFGRAEEILQKALISPKIGDGEDEISLFDIPSPDVAYLAGVVMSMSAIGKGSASKINPS